MIPTSKNVTRTYYTLTLLSTLSASFIWGVNTLFLLDAGLSNTQAFAANAFFTLGQVLFEVPTGIVADTRGRKISYALGVGTLILTTFAYYMLWQIHGPFWAWALVSALLGLGFTFFSGATEAWLVDALNFTGFKGHLESVFAKGQAIGGAAMLIGSVAGGLVAQATNLGVPYILRVVLLGLTLSVCLIKMRDLGFTPHKGENPLAQVRTVLRASIEHGWKRPPVRFMMLSAPFTGVSIFIFYAMQPHLLNLYGNQEAYGIAGLAAAIVAGAQIVGSMLVNKLRLLFKSRTTILISAMAVSVLAVLALGVTTNFWLAILFLVIWGLIFSVAGPVQQAYLNSQIESKERATVLSFASLLQSSGGAVSQPALGKVADVYGYGPSYLVSGLFQALSIPFLLLAKRTHAPSDVIEQPNKENQNNSSGGV